MTIDDALAPLSKWIDEAIDLDLSAHELWGHAAADEDDATYGLVLFKWSDVPEEIQSQLMGALLFVFAAEPGTIEGKGSSGKWVSQTLVPFGVIMDLGVPRGALLFDLAQANGNRCPVFLYEAGNPARLRRRFAGSAEDLIGKLRLE